MEANSTQGGDKNSSASPSSDLGSSYDSASSDAKSNTKLGSDDVISMDGSASLTLDSLEEEEEVEDDLDQNEEKHEENGNDDTMPAKPTQPPNKPEDSDHTIQHSGTGKETKSCSDKCQLSDSAAQSNEKKPSNKKPVKPTRKTLSNNSESRRSTSNNTCSSETKETVVDGKAKSCKNVQSSSSDSSGQKAAEEGKGKEAASEESASEQADSKRSEEEGISAACGSQKTSNNVSEQEQSKSNTVSLCSKCGEARNDSTGTTAIMATTSKPENGLPEGVIVVTGGSNCEESSTDPEPRTLSSNCHNDLKTVPSSPHHEHPHPHSAGASPARAPTTLSIRKTRSMTESGEPSSPSKNSRIPRRKSFAGDHSRSMYSTSSGRSTPQHSPATFRRSLTLNSATLTHHNSFRQSSPLPRSADSSPGSTAPASFPQTPVKVCGERLKRSASHQDNVSMVSSCFSTPLSRDTITSRLRFEKHHMDHDRDALDKADAYLTPYQRKDLLIKELKAQVKDLTRQLDDWQRHEQCRKEEMEEEKEQTIATLQSEVAEANSLKESAQKEVASLKESHEQSVKTVATLQQELENVKKEMASQLSQAEDIFLEMYKKGRESAIFEREEELEHQGKGKRSADATETELRNKLERTQAELAKWQTLQRHESYHTSLMPGTEAETTLRFLKDAVFHYLTADKKACDEHLRAIVRILRFSDVQREKIAYAIIHRRNKAGW